MAQRISGERGDSSKRRSTARGSLRRRGGPTSNPLGVKGLGEIALVGMAPVIAWNEHDQEVYNRRRPQDRRQGPARAYRTETQDDTNCHMVISGLSCVRLECLVWIEMSGR